MWFTFDVIKFWGRRENGDPQALSPYGNIVRMGTPSARAHQRVRRSRAVKRQDISESGVVAIDLPNMVYKKQQFHSLRIIFQNLNNHGSIQKITNSRCAWTKTAKKTADILVEESASIKHKHSRGRRHSKKYNEYDGRGKHSWEDEYDGGGRHLWQTWSTVIRRGSIPPAARDSAWTYCAQRWFCDACISTH